MHLQSLLPQPTLPPFLPKYHKKLRRTSNQPQKGKNHIKSTSKGKKSYQINPSATIQKKPLLIHPVSYFLLSDSRFHIPSHFLLCFPLLSNLSYQKPSESVQIREIKIFLICSSCHLVLLLVSTDSHLPHR